MCQRDFLVTNRPGFFINQHFCCRNRYNLIGEDSGFLRGSRTGLALYTEFILRFAADAIAFGDGLGGFNHAHISMFGMAENRRIFHAVGILMFVLHQADGFQAAGNDNIHTVIHDLFGGGGNRHHAG